jgi:hypothetical protein
LLASDVDPVTAAQGQRAHGVLSQVVTQVSISVIAISTLAVTTASAGVLDAWGKPALLKEFFMEYRIKFHQEGTHITSITPDRKGKGSGNACFHGGECYALMLAVARGPGSRVNFEKDVTTTADNIWVDKVTGNRLKGDDSEQSWRFEVDDKSGTPILTGELKNGSDFAIARGQLKLKPSRDK